MADLLATCPMLSFSCIHAVLFFELTLVCPCDRTKPVSGGRVYHHNVLEAGLAQCHIPAIVARERSCRQKALMEASAVTASS
jgi:hypothetical protein